MGYPPHTVELPRWDDALAAEVSDVALDPERIGWELRAALRDEHAAANGHLCSTAWVLDRSGEHTLLVRHRRLGWANPGGHTETGETLVQGARRELREETGLDLPPAVDHPVLLHRAEFPAGSEHAAHVHWNVGFLFISDPGAHLVPEPGAPLAWWPLDALPGGAVDDLAVNLPLIAQWWRAQL